MKEIRNNNNVLSTSDESRTIEGYGVVFNSLSNDLGGFKEIILSSAISDETIRKSDILFLLDHNKERGVLARSQYGKGSLQLEIDERGLKYTFDSPKTALGDEVLEGIRRGDISKCSFAFVVEEDDWKKESDGTIIRTIEKIKQLYDVSAVYSPAYEDTVVINKRGLEEMINEENKVDEETKIEEEIRATEESEKEGNVNEIHDDKEFESTEKDDSNEEEKESDKEDETEKNEERNLNEPNLYNKVNIKNHNIMNKFSLIKTINDVVNNRNLDEVSLNIIKEGRKAANNANVETNGQIVLALEKRADADATVTPNGIMATQETMGKEAIPTETFEIVGALRDKMVLAEAGAQFMSLQGNVEIPLYSGANCAWASEIGEAQDGSGKFTSVKLAPKRLTATLPISRQFLIQSSDSAEALLRNDLINAIAEKLQKTILSNGAGDAVTPKGMLYGVTADAAAFTYDDAVNMEAVLESANVYGDYKYIVSPNAKAVLRTTSMDKGSGKFLYENNAVLGVDALSTNSAVNKGVILGDWKELLIGVFGALDIVVDPYTAAAKGQVILTVNAYFDYVERKPEAFVKRILK